MPMLPAAHVKGVLLLPAAPCLHLKRAIGHTCVRTSPPFPVSDQVTFPALDSEGFQKAGENQAVI